MLFSTLINFRKIFNNCAKTNSFLKILIADLLIYMFSAFLSYIIYLSTNITEQKNITNITEQRDVICFDCRYTVQRFYFTAILELFAPCMMYY